MQLFTLLTPLHQYCKAIIIELFANVCYGPTILDEMMSILLEVAVTVHVHITILSRMRSLISKGRPFCIVTAL